MTLTAQPADRTGTAEVLVVDDHRLLAEALQTTLGLHGLAVELSACASAEAILDEARRLRPGLVVLDLDLAGVGVGGDLVRPLIDLGAGVLILSGSTDRIELARCLEHGALGVVSKAEPFGDVLDKIRRAATGEPATPVTVRAQYLEELRRHRAEESSRLAPFRTLTAREQQVLTLIVDGQPAADIARLSFVSLPTVRTQIRSILLKLGVRSQSAAAALARHAGWTPTEVTR